MIESTRVLIRDCPQYNTDKIRSLILEGMEEFGVRPAGRVFVKPSVVFSHYDEETFGRDAYTNRLVVEGVLRALSEFTEVEQVSVGEKGGVGIPTRVFLKWAKYHTLISNLKAEGYPRPLELFCLEEDTQVETFVGGMVHSYMHLPSRMLQADFRLYLPKLKKHSATGITAALQPSIGMCSDDERSIHHDYLYDEKIADLALVRRPHFVVLDAVTVGVGIEINPAPRHVGVLIMGTDPLAIDLAVARIYNLDGASEVGPIKALIARGHTPGSLEEVEVFGDYRGVDGLDELGLRVKPFDQDFFAWHDVSRELDRLGCPMRFHHGPYSEDPRELCKPGCLQGLEIALSMIECHAPRAFPRARPITIVIGRHREPIDAQGEVALAIGKCTDAQLVNARKVVRIDKCFSSASDLIFHLCFYSRLPNPALRLRFLWGVATAFIATMVVKLVNLSYIRGIIHFFRYRLLRKL